MSHYCNPPRDVQRIGRELVDASSLDRLEAQLEDNEVVIELYDRGRFLNAPWLHSAAEFEEFESQARDRIISRIGFFAVTRNEADAMGANLPPVTEEARP